MHKRKLGTLILASVIVLSIVFLYIQKEPNSTEQVLSSLFENYDVNSTQIDGIDPVIWIDVFDKNDIPEVEKYLKSKMSKDDLKHYEIVVISQWS